MGINIKEEYKRAEFLDFVNNNKDKIIEFLLLEYEDLLFKIYKNKEKWSVLK